MRRVADFPKQTVAALFQEALEDCPERSILRDSGNDLSRAGLWKESLALANGLDSIGVRKGDLVGVLIESPNTFVLTWFSLIHLGAILVPINGELKNRQLEHVIRHSEMTYLVTDSAAAATLATLPEKSSLELKAVIVSGPGADEVGGGRIRFRESLRLDRLKELRGNRQPIALDPRETAAILYTGGTTGPAKGVLCSHAQYYWWALLMARILEIRSNDRWFTCLPFFHINAQATLLATLAAGATTVTEGRFSASRYWQQVRDSRATVASLLGTMAYILFHSRPPSPQDRDHHLRAVFCPGISAAVKPLFEERFGVGVVNAYGMTELNCVSATAVGDSTPATSMGQPLPEFEVAIVDENDERLGEGMAGELVVRPRRPFSVMSGYHRMPEETVEAWRNLWFHSGDRAYQDSAGHLHFVDRLKDCIRRRGENISSHDIELVVSDHPAVLEAAAYPVPSEIGEQDVMVSMVLFAGLPVEMTELAQWCEERLARFAVPRYFRVVPELPKTAVGRVQKFALRETGVTEDSWDRGKG